jgi:hypothetical protein
MSDETAPTETEALAEAIAAAETALNEATRRANNLEHANRKRALQLQNINVKAGLDAAAIRELVDRVNLSDPADLEKARTACVRAEVEVVKARQAAITPHVAQLEAEAERLRITALEAEQEWRRADRAFKAANPVFNGYRYTLNEVQHRVALAEQAEADGARSRLAALTGQQAEQPDDNGYRGLTQHVTWEFGRL